MILGRLSQLLGMNPAGGLARSGDYVGLVDAGGHGGMASLLHPNRSLDILATRYALVSPKDEALFQGNARWKRIDRFPGTIAYENRHVLPRAWLASQVIQLSADQVAQSIVTGQLPDGTPFDPATTALLETPPPWLGDAGPKSGSAEVSRITPTTVTVRTDSARPAFLVLSDVNYPGWEADVDGRSVPIYQTDYLLRGVAVPAGRHVVRFVFRSKTLYAGAAISGASALTLLLIAAAGYFKLKRVKTLAGDRRIRSSHSRA
jgi:hypothetical protein